MGRHGINPLTDVTFSRYRRVRNETRSRMGADEITNEEFMCLLLDVYEYHLEPHHDQGMDTKEVLLDG